MCDDESGPTPGDFFGQPASHFSSFVNVRVDHAMPSSEALEKRAGCCGLFKWAARRRNGVVASVTIFVAVLLGVAATLTAVVFFIGVGTVASGLVYRGPQRLPWHGETDYRNTLLGDTVLLANGERVEHVVEPREQMSTVNHVLLLASALARADTVPGINSVTPEDVRRGYLPWQPFELAPRVNFTLEHMQRLLRSKHAGDTCVCYKSYGLPYDVVYLVASDTVLYEPRVLSESPERVKVLRDCIVYKLIKQARRETDWQRDEQFESARSGRVHYITAAGLNKRTVIEAPEFPCVQHCLSIFEVDAALAVQ